MSDTSRTSLKQLFSYVRALTERRFEAVQSYNDYPFHLKLADLPQHDIVRTPCFEDTGDEINPNADVILTVGKAEIQSPPAVPVALIGWLRDGWDDPAKTLAPVDSRTTASPDGGEVSEAFGDDAERMKSFDIYNAKRAEWAEKSGPVYAARELYDRLYTLYSEMERDRDAVELMIGDGIIETKAEDGTKICHPIVLERVTLRFDSSLPGFTIADSDANPMLYTRLLRMIPGLECACLSDYSNKIEAELIHPFEGERFDDLLMNLANSLSSDCEFVPEGGKSTAKYTIRRGAVLFKRQRSSGYSAILDKIIEDIDVSPELSPSLVSIVCQTAGEQEQQPEDENESAGRDAMEVNGISADVLLEKSANREQLLIAKKLKNNPAVLVQGPPGTGKTHTISNIIGDLLAQGKSVLVTSQTSKALDVLRDKISEPIRPLCVSVLDDNRKQLEESLRVINEMTSGNDIDTLDLEAERFRRERDAVISELTELKGHLTSLVEQEYRPFMLDGTEYAPKKAAQYISSLAGEEFIPDSVDADTALPLDAEQLAWLYRSNTELNGVEEQLLSSGAPEASELMTPARFRQICDIIGAPDNSASDAEKTDGADAQTEAPADDTASLWSASVTREASALSELAAELRQLSGDVESAAQSEPWKIKLAETGIKSADCALFDRIAEGAEKLRQTAAAMTMEIADTKPYIPDELINEASQTLFEEIYHALDTEKINWLMVAIHPKWKQLLDRCLINGEKPDTRSEVKTMARYVKLQNDRIKLRKRWKTSITDIGGPALSADKPEEQAIIAWPTVTEWLKLYEARWLPLRDRLKEMGFDWARYEKTLPLEARMSGELASMRAMLTGGLPEIVDMEYGRGDRSECTDALDREARVLLPYAERFELIGNLRSAITQRDRAAYKQYYDAYDTVCLKRPSFEKRLNMLETLTAAAPQWADAIAKREGVNGGDAIPADINKHWLRARMRGYLDRYASDEITNTQKRIDELSSQLSSLTRELISRKAWSAQLRTMLDPNKKRSLETWATLVKRVGKGTGKRAEQLLASGELRRAMKECRRAVPVWIMPIAAVAENFEPSDEKFDVLIIDEASQADLTALIALYLAKKVIVVGDDKQVSPTPIGLELEVASKLRNEFLRDVPAAAMYDELVSIYDLGRANYQPITLREHFRCADDIINFSNYYTYNGIISPLRDSSSLKLHPAVVAYHVNGGAASGKKTNMREAETIVSLIVACVEQPEYDGFTFGVITMLGDEQALVIDRMLRRRLTEDVYQKRQILCGNPSYFQGDERDIIFISLVDASKEDGGVLAVRREGYNEMYAKRYNVAASRAKDQMWVVYSMDPDSELKSDDIRLSLIRHALDPAATAAALEKEQPTALTEMEKAVSRTLSEAGYNVTARQKVGSYIVGMTCEGAGGRVAIECDGDCERDANAIADELNKQSVLERLGWRFLRLRASDYYRAPDKFAEALVQQIHLAGLKPATARNEQPENTLMARLKERSEQLLAEWAKAPETEEAVDGTEPADSAETAPDAEAAEAQTAEKKPAKPRAKRTSTKTKAKAAPAEEETAVEQPAAEENAPAEASAEQPEAAEPTEAQPEKQVQTDGGAAE